AAVLPVRERRERGAQAQAEVVPLAGEVLELRPVDDAVEVSDARLGVRHDHAHLRAHAVGHAERRVERVELNVDRVGLGDRLERPEPGGEGVGRELVAYEREGAGGVESHGTMLTPVYPHRYAGALPSGRFVRAIAMHASPSHVADATAGGPIRGPRDLVA